MSAASSWSSWRLKLDGISKTGSGDAEVTDAQNLIDKAWLAGTLGYRRSTQAQEDDGNTYLKLALLIKRIIDSRDREFLLNQIFTTPRNTGVLLLGICSLLQWRYESYIVKLIKILHDVKCGSVQLAVVPSRGNGCVAVKKKRNVSSHSGADLAQETRDMDDGRSVTSDVSTLVEIPEALLEKPWASHVDLMADFSTFLQDLEGNQDSLQSQLTAHHIPRLDSFRLHELDVEDDMVLADSVPLVIDDEDETSFFALTGSSGSHPANLIGGDLRATSQFAMPQDHTVDKEMDAGHVTGTSPPIPSLNLVDTISPSPPLDTRVMIDSDFSESAPSDATELVTMRHAEAPSARVRRRDSLDQEASVLREAGKADHRRVLKQVPPKEGIGLFPPKRLKGLFVLEDTDGLTRNDPNMDEGGESFFHITGGLASSFDWRAITEIPNLWRYHIKKLSLSLEERYRLMISNALLNKFFEHSMRTCGPTESLYSSDYFNDDWRNEDPLNPDPVEMDDLAHSRASSDRRSARFGLSGSSLSASSSNRIDMNTPALSLDERDTIPPQSCMDVDQSLEAMMSPGPVESTVANSLGEFGSPHIEMAPDDLELSSRTVSHAESRYNPHTWQMLCVVRKNIKKRAEALHQPPDATFISFHDLVPPHMCRKANATQAIYQILLLLTLNELICHQETAFGSIKIMLGPGPLGATVSTAMVTSTGTWSSEDAGILRSIDSPDMQQSWATALALVPDASQKATHERKRSRALSTAIADPEGSSAASSGEGSGSARIATNENEEPQQANQARILRSKRRRLHNS